MQVLTQREWRTQVQHHLRQVEAQGHVVHWAGLVQDAHQQALQPVKAGERGRKADLERAATWYDVQSSLLRHHPGERFSTCSR